MHGWGWPVLPRGQHRAQPWQARRALVPRLSVSRGTPRHRTCQEKRACCSSVCLEEALRPSLLEAENGKSDSKNPQQGHHVCTIFCSLFPGGLRHLGVPSFVSFSPNVRHFTHYYFFTVPHTIIPSPSHHIWGPVISVAHSRHDDKSSPFSRPPPPSQDLRDSPGHLGPGHPENEPQTAKEPLSELIHTSQATRGDHWQETKQVY